MRTPFALPVAQRCPNNPPQMSGIHVTGLVSCTRIFQMSVSSDAPFMPSSWRAALSLLSFFSSVACWFTALRATRPVRVLQQVPRRSVIKPERPMLLAVATRVATPQQLTKSWADADSAKRTCNSRTSILSRDGAGPALGALTESLHRCALQHNLADRLIRDCSSATLTTKLGEADATMLRP